MLFGMMLLSTHMVQAGTEGEDKSGDPLKIKIFVFDFVPLPEGVRQQVEHRVAEIYKETGVRMEWDSCSVGEGQTALYPGCTIQENAPHLFLRIHSHVWKGMKSEVAGDTNIPARIINVYWDRVQYEATCLRLPPPQVLAHVVAHEIGHLWLGPDAHGAGGIMAAKWRSQELIDIVQGALKFTPRQRDRINAEVRKEQASSSP
jgi:hypothetical protein